MEISVEQNSPGGPKWQPLSSMQRRVIGVLIEKSKTTPDAYPMTLNGIAIACNQKSNRDPQMNVATDDAELTLEELREMGAVSEVQGVGRVVKYRHRLYEWLGVDKTEIAVMAELLLRGEQTVGELRGRASRMEQIADLSSMRPMLHTLIEKGLVISLTPEGRGQIVTHALYKDREMKELQARHAAAPPNSSSSDASERVAKPATPRVTPDMLSELQVEVTELRAEVSRLKGRVELLEGKV